MERDAQGRFAKGNRGGPGRPPRKTEERYLRAMTRAVLLKDWRAIVKRAVAQARTGDKDARRWLSDYLLGRPVQRAEIQTEVAGDFIVWQWGEDEPAASDDDE